MTVAVSKAEEALQQQQDELAALEAIYGGDCVVSADRVSCQVYIPDSTHIPSICLRVHLPPDYPISAPPIPELAAPHLSDDVKACVIAELEAQFAAGEVVLYTWVEWLKDQQQLWAPASGPEQPSPDRLDSDAKLAEALQQAEISAQQEASASDERTAHGMAEDLIIHGEPFTEHKSTFQAHLAPATSAEDVEKCMNTLLQHNKIRNATHNILAYRIYVESRDAWLQDYDDDGEDAAGGRLLHLLQILDVKNTVVVVSRWYGGVKLGPARFTHINNAARLLLEKCGCLQSETVTAITPRKKGKRH
ncbi:hypothetical protein ABBQ38_006154 [Trebouxia sp. C0009 RCD-2024]